MSRLIFEGDTTDRFGRLFPKPFIQEIRVFDDNVETDIAVYFQIEEDTTDIDDFLSETGLDKLRIFTGPVWGNALDNLQQINHGLGYIYSSLKIERLAVDSGRTPDDFSSYTLSEFKDTVQFFYNSEGSKFVKFLITDNTWQNYTFKPDDADVERNVVALTFFDDVDVTDAANYINIARNFALYGKQTSDVSYEKVFNADGTLNTGKKTVFREPNGNAYNGIPLKSLDNTFRKTLNTTHEDVINLVSPIVSPSVGAIEEADRVSATLSEYANDPSLVTQLKKDINSFSNKSSATITGQLYGRLVDVLSDIDNLLQTEETLDNRLEPNLKVKDRRLEPVSPPSGILDASSTSYLQGNDTTGAESSYFPAPLVYRNLESIVPLSDFSNQTQAYIANKVYLFFDYEKALNYKPLISDIFNPYALRQLYGNNSLNQFFKIETVQVELRRPNTLQQTFTYVPYMFEDAEFSGRGFFLTEEVGNIYETNDLTLYNGSEKYKFKTKFCERAFDTANSLAGYRLKLYELDYLKHYDYINDREKLSFKVKISDTSMEFYNIYIRDKMFALNEKLQEYLFFAEQYCSYNNIDGRFNDFFNEEIVAQFEEPYPWEEAPLFYYSLLALVLNSWNYTNLTADNIPRLATRKLDGEILNFDAIKQSALTMNERISPTSGDLESVINFARIFKAYFDRLIDIGGAFDTDVGAGGADIYTEVGGLTQLTSPQVSLELSPLILFTSDTTVDIDVKIVNPAASNFSYPRPSSFERDTNFITIKYDKMLEYLRDFVSNDLEVDFRINLVDVSDDTDREIRSGTKKLMDFYNDNIIQGNENYFINDITEQKIELYLEPLLYDFATNVVTSFSADIRTFQNTKEPEEYWKDSFGELEDSVERFLIANPERMISKPHNTDNSKAIEYHFIVNRESLEKYMGRLASYYWTYSYYYGDGESEDGVFPEPVTMQEFLRAINILEDRVDTTTDEVTATMAAPEA